ncbi:MAG TPA: ROK family transcriptional regulator [Solirubrobacter sp.]|nr:ROK family transcriptional regulator [Solirubrobacter sp.]
MSDVTAVSTTRELNRLRVVEMLLRHPSRSRSELGAALGLSRATITTVLSELEDAGIVQQHADGGVAQRASRAIGRPPLQVSLTPSAAYAVGLDLGHAHVRAAVCDLRGRIVTERSARSGVGSDPFRAFDVARRLTDEALLDAGVDRTRVLGAGVGLAVPVDPVTDAVHVDGILDGWAGVAPAAELQARLGMPVRVENDANAGALAEHIFGGGRGVDDMVYLRLSAGIGLGLIMRGLPYRGVAGVAGEIGHVTVVDDGLICRCGNRGCLETVASPLAVSALLERSRGEPMPVERLFELAASGDRGVQRAIVDAGRAVGRALAATVNLLNPGLVIVGGDLAQAGDLLLNPIRTAIQEAAVAPAVGTVRVIASQLGDRAEVLGAAAIQLVRAPSTLTGRLA